MFVVEHYLRVQVTLSLSACHDKELFPTWSSKSLIDRFGCSEGGKIAEQSALIMLQIALYYCQTISIDLNLARAHVLLSYIHL